MSVDRTDYRGPDGSLTVRKSDNGLHGQAELNARRNGDTRPRIVLVLSGGGMRGYAHIGVIRAIERLRLFESKSPTRILK